MGKPRFRYIIGDGSEQYLADSRALVEAIESEVLQPDTMLFDANIGRWQRAAQCQAYILASELSASDRESHPSELSVALRAPSPTDPEPEERGAPASPSERPIPSTEKHLPASRFSVTRWIAAALALAWLGFTIAAERLDGSSFATILGYLFGQGLIFAVIGFLVHRFMDQRRPAIGWAIVSGLFALVAIRTYGDNRRVVEDLRATASSIIQASAGTAPVPLGSDTLTLNYVFSSLANVANAAWVEYNKALERVSDNWFSPAMLSNSAGRDSASSTVEVMREATIVLASSLEQNFETAGRRLERLGTHKAEYGSAADIYRRTVPGTQELLQEFVRVEFELLAAFDSLLALVTQTPPELDSDGVTLLFPDDIAVEAYDRWSGNLQLLAVEEENALAALRERSLRTIRQADSLRNLLH